MRRFIHSKRSLLAVLGVVAAALLLLPIAQAGPDEPSVPEDIQVPVGNKVFLVGHATGVQIYACGTTATGGFAWSLLAPRATLYDDAGKPIVTHFAGPTWRARDGSTVVGQLAAKVIVDRTAIPWLKLSGTGVAGPDGDRLAETSYIQRIATVGGVMPPAGECNETTAGTSSEVPYTADYYFWKQTGA